LEVPVSTILFVDDHHALRSVFAEVLRTAGHTVLEAGTLTDAEHLVERQSSAIDLLVVEAVLTTTDGLDIAQRLQPSIPEMQVLFISEQPAENLLEEGSLPEGAHFLRKPFAAEELTGKLKQLAEARVPARRSSPLPAAGVKHKKPPERSKRSTRATQRAKTHKK
jgi:DNA-binding response OmpR family regulator